MRALLLVMLFSCHRSDGKVTITSWPGKVELVREEPRCYIPEAPVVPDKPPWPSSDEDYYRRVYVHRGDYEKLHDFVADLVHYQEYLRDCLDQIVEIY